MKTSKKKKVLFFLESLSGGGAEKVLLTLIKYLDKTHFDVTVYSLIETGVYVTEMKKHCNVIYGLKEYHNYSFFGKIYYKIKYQLIYKGNSKLIYRWLIKDNYDIEIAFVEGFGTKLISSSCNKKSKKYAWIHIDMIANNHSDKHFKNNEEQKDAYQKFDKIFAVSNHVKDSFIKKFNIKNVAVQYNPVDSNEIIFKAKDKVILSREKINLMTIGRLENQKGYDRLLRVIKRLKDAKYDFELYILGDGSLKDSFKDYIELNNLEEHVKLLGFKSNPYQYLASADIFVCSSYSEGFSTVATEALILGIPIITTDCSGMKELFGGYDCGIITKNDEDSLFEAIEYTLNHLKNLDYYKSQIEKRKCFFDIKDRIKEIEVLLDE